MLKRKRNELAFKWEQNECCICLEVYRNPRILPCGHSFCFQCLFIHFISQLKNKIKNNVKHFSLCCPLCHQSFQLVNNFYELTNYPNQLNNCFLYNEEEYEEEYEEIINNNDYSSLTSLNNNYDSEDEYYREEDENYINNNNSDDEDGYFDESENLDDQHCDVESLNIQNQRKLIRLIAQIPKNFALSHAIESIRLYEQNIENAHLNEDSQNLSRVNFKKRKLNNENNNEEDEIKINSTTKLIQKFNKEKKKKIDQMANELAMEIIGKVKKTEFKKYCEIHSRNKLRFFCGKCKQIICKRCKKEHFRHDVKRVKEAFLMKEKELLQVCDWSFNQEVQLRVLETANLEKKCVELEEQLNALLNDWNESKIAQLNVIQLMNSMKIVIEKLSNSSKFHLLSSKKLKLFQSAINERISSNFPSISQINLLHRDFSWMMTSDEYRGMKPFPYHPNIYLFVSKENDWSKVEDKKFDLPIGFHWARSIEFIRMMGDNKDNTKGYAYYGTGGWKGYEWENKKRKMFCFADSKETNLYKDAGCATANYLNSNLNRNLPFAGIVCIKDSN